MKDEDVKTLFGKLDTVIKLLASNELKSIKTDLNKVEFLDSLKLSNKDIAMLLNKDLKRINRIRYNVKKRIK